MIDLKNTWCQATEENYKALVKLGLETFRNLDGSTDGGYYLAIKMDSFKEADIMYTNTLEGFKKKYNIKQIHLVNGEFQYVETKAKNNFKDYGFEADFEGEILKKIDNFYYGIVNQHNRFETITWNLVGRPISGSTALNKYELWKIKPIKKEWYENPDNFPCIIISLKTNKPHIAYNYNHVEEKIKQETFSAKPDKFRPATKEEVLTLLVKE